MVKLLVGTVHRNIMDSDSPNCRKVQNKLGIVLCVALVHISLNVHFFTSSFFTSVGFTCSIGFTLTAGLKEEEKVEGVEKVEGDEKVEEEKGEGGAIIPPLGPGDLEGEGH